MSNVEVKVRDRNTAEEVGRFRTGPGGWLKVTVDAFFVQVVFEARPDAQTLGWASVRSGELTPTGRENDPVKMVLLPRDHQVEGSVVDVRGNPIRGVAVQVVQLDHLENRFATSYGHVPAEASLGSAVTDAAGRYTLTLPQDTRAIFAAYHPRYFGPILWLYSRGPPVNPVTLEDAGGIGGTVIDSITKQPVEGAKVGAQLVEHHDRILSADGATRLPTRTASSSSAACNPASTTCFLWLTEREDVRCASCRRRARQGGRRCTGRSRGNQGPPIARHGDRFGGQQADGWCPDPLLQPFPSPLGPACQVTSYRRARSFRDVRPSGAGVRLHRDPGIYRTKPHGRT